MQEIGHELKMYKIMLKTTIRSMAQYPADFLISLLGVILLNCANIVQLGVIAWRFQSVDGWNVAELMMLYGMCMVSWSIYSIFFKNLNNVENEIVSGNLDRYLMKPMSPYLQLIGGEIRYSGLCDTLLGGLLMMTGCSMLRLNITFKWFIMLVLFIICGGVIVVCIQTTISCAAFVFTKASALRSIMTHIYMLVQKYPISIFGKPFRILVTAVLPVAFLNYYPVSYLLNKTSDPNWLMCGSPIVVLVMVGITSFVWRRCLRLYNGTGG